MPDDWISIKERLPTDGEIVFVKALHSDQPQQATFKQHPVARWESGNIVFQLERFAYWRRKQARQKVGA
jgi:hypothetical protein